MRKSLFRRRGSRMGDIGAHFVLMLSREKSVAQSHLDGAVRERLDRRRQQQEDELDTFFFFFY